ncbi:MAG: acyl-CoA dehydratase activase [Clostridiales Family XIII bacterium]|nr:acyl-CoA dehydratase activase [Clostridiales Family XIII bacterium]
MFIGIDIGSTSSKAAVIDGEGNLLSHEVANLGAGTSGPGDAIGRALSVAGISRSDISFSVVTGYGRVSYKDANKQMTEISCHAKGATFLIETEIATIIDIGGQDAKVIRLDENGNVKNFVMNEKCAAGTGRFLEVMARVLGVPIENLSELASKATHDIPISSVCTVFAESEVISRLASGESLEDVAKGALAAVAKRIAGMSNRVGYAPPIVMTGGVALNESIVRLIGIELGEAVTVAPYPQSVGAIGAAAYAYEIMGKSQ